MKKRKACYGYDSELDICLIYGVLCEGYSSDGQKHECYHETKEEFIEADRKGLL